MDAATIAVGAVLGATLLLVGRWQGRLEKERSAEALAKLKDAKSRGADKAIAQYPLIDEAACLGCGSCIAACPEHDVIGLVGGVAKIIHGAHCVGHGKCEAACPVGAIKVGLGDVSKRTDIPQLSSQYESSVPGVYVIGELGGIALIRNAIEQGTRAVEDIARRAKAEPAAAEAGVLDLLIVGSGPSGLGAAFRAKELGLSVAIVSQDDLGGTIRKYPRRKLTLIQQVQIPVHGFMKEGEYEKEDLLALLDGALKKSGLTVSTGESLVSVERSGGLLVTKTSRGEHRSRFVALALGRRGTPRRLGVPGEDSDRVFYQLLDAATYTGQRILVVGGGDSAVEAAMGLARQPGNRVTLSYRKPDFFRLKPRNEARIKEAVAEGALKLLLPSDVLRFETGAAVLACGPADARVETVLPTDWTFVFAGGDPPFPLLQKIGVRFGGEPKPAAAKASA
ncbi:MAG: NAD(P)-binding domain-containing protein [Elusimicrobiota bacterium]